MRILLGFMMALLYLGLIILGYIQEWGPYYTFVVLFLLPSILYLLLVRAGYQLDHSPPKPRKKSVPPSLTLTPEQAANLLGLALDAGEEAINQAAQQMLEKLMNKPQPQAAPLAQAINHAKTVLLHYHKESHVKN